MSRSLRRGKREREARKRHRRGSVWSNFGPAAGITLKLGRVKRFRLSAAERSFSLVNRARTEVAKAESREAASAGDSP